MTIDYLDTNSRRRICLSRLYSPFPYLHYPVHLLPTASHPLTPSYPPSSSTSKPSFSQITVPANTHLATPRMLLSMLATTIYLGQTAFMREILAMILRTISPASVVRYLRFAIGDGIREEEWDGQSEASATDLKELGRVMQHRKDSGASESSGEGRNENEDNKVGGRASDSHPRSNFSTSTSRVYPPDSVSTRQEASFVSDELERPSHFYGFASNKIGEACVCYLSRWGTDILSYELSNPASSPIFGTGGLPARFVAALLGTDSFWVKGEMERYRTARAIIDLRRKAWEEYTNRGTESSSMASFDEDSAEREWDDDEMELGKVFTEGIIYTHMVGLFYVFRVSSLTRA